MGIARFALATVAAIAAGIALAYGWRMLVIDIAPAELSRPLGHTESVAVFSASQLGKYIPGSVWPVVAQMSLARRHGIPRRTIVAAFVVQLLLLVVSAVLVAAATLPWVDPDELKSRWWLLVVAPAICVLLVPRVQRWLLGTAGRILNRDSRRPLPGRGAMARTVAMSVLTYVLFGIHLALLAWPLSSEPDGKVFVQAIGAFALAWAAGFVVIFAPAGLGVREVVLTLTMGSVLSSADATALAVLSRTSIVIADLVLGLFGIAVVSRGRKLAAAQHDEDVGRGLALGGLDVGDEPEDEDLGRHEHADGGADEARHPAGVVAGELQDEPPHDEDEPDDAGDR